MSTAETRFSCIRSQKNESGQSIISWNISQAAVDYNRRFCVFINLEVKIVQEKVKIVSKCEKSYKKKSRLYIDGKESAAL